MRSGTLSGFRTKFRGAGGLIVDDVQFLAAKRATMIEFLYTFNALFDKGAPIILSADQHPRQISRLSDELVTRFLAGMVVRIESPDLMTRGHTPGESIRTRGSRARGGRRLYRRTPPGERSRARRGSPHGDHSGRAHRPAGLDLTLAQAALRDSIRHTTVSIGMASGSEWCAISFR